MDLISLFVNRPMVPSTQQGEVRELCRASLRPVPDVMTLPEPSATPGEAAATVSVVQRPA